MNCPKCGEQLPNDSVFCSYCGCNIEEVANASREKHCINCGNSLPEDSCFCPYCGTKTESNLQVAPPAKPPEPKPAKKAKKKTLIIACTVLALVAVMIAGVLAAPHLVLRVKYSHANSLLKNGKYDAAYSAFEELGEYEDAETMLSETRYLEAIALQKAGDYDSANKILKELGDYKDSKALYHRHVYEVAERDEPSCTEAGSYTNRCSGCGHTYTNPLSATGHTYQVKSKTDPTCTKEGEIIHYCIDCGLEKTETTPVQKHNYTLTSSKEATCLATGIRVQTCTECGKTTEEIMAKQAHNYLEATCESPKICKTCGQASGTALGHTDGNICSRCGKIQGFTAQRWEGNGSKVISGINLPPGKYSVSFSYWGQSGFSVSLKKDTSTISIFNRTTPTTFNNSDITISGSGIQNASFNVVTTGGEWFLSVYQ